MLRRSIHNIYLPVHSVPRSNVRISINPDSISSTGYMVIKNISVLLSVAQLVVLVNSVAAQNSVPGTKQLKATEPALCPAALSATVTAIANRYNLQRYHWGYHVQALNSPTAIASYQGNSLFLPASTTKLLTTAATLRQLGGQYRLRTSVYQDPGSNLQQPSLTVVGRGDPTITNTQIQELARQLQQKGLRQIEQLTTSSTYFRGSPMNPDWEWGDLYTDYGVPVTSLILQQNTVDLLVTPQKVGQAPSYRWRTPLAGIPWQIDNRARTGNAGSNGSIEAQGVQGQPVIILQGNVAINAGPITLNLAMLNPNATWLNQLQFDLSKQQINVGQVRVLNTEPLNLSNEVAAIESPPLEDLVKEINRNSNNLFAEILLRTIGRNAPNHASSSASTADLGLQLIRDKLSQIGVTPSIYRQADGSGLSRKNLIPPLTLVQTLIGMSKTPEASIYRESMSMSGVNGTLGNRFKNYPNRIQGKTGSLTGVIALAGYANPEQYQPLAFSIIVNDHDRPNSEIRSAVDEIATAFLRLKNCP
jgi:serine-type D-Ala-D-Ala carboxypeptidase/endopeptidase (penicillin-binding protein 4)